MKRSLLILNLLLLVAIAARAQYTTAGKIEYERKMNVFAQMTDWGDDDGSESEWITNYKATNPQFRNYFFDLYFNNTRSIYKPGQEVEGNSKWAPGEGPAKENIVLSDFITKQVKAVKLVYEQKFFVQDSMRKLDWKEKDEIRTIASYKCHKAVAKICDSVYVVAFYTEDIPTSGGPEMFGGLPGMIMELAIPRLHTTWTATKVELIAPQEADFAISDKGKKVNEKGLYETIQSSLKSWGKWATKNVWWTVL